MTGFVGGCGGQVDLVLDAEEDGARGAHEVVFQGDLDAGD